MGLSFVEHYDAATVVVDDDALVAVRERIAADGPRLPLAGPALDEAARQAARQAVADLVDKQTLDAVLEKIKRDGLRLTGPGGFLSEPGGCRPSSPSTWATASTTQAGRSSGNSRNGSAPKTVQTEVGPIDVRVPRDRAGTFTPVLLPKTPAAWADCPMWPSACMPAG
jgi:putative transposase